MPIRRRKNSAGLSVSWLWLSVRWKDEGYREAFIRVRGALALGDDFRSIFRFVARADAAPFVNRMALSVCQRLLGHLGLDEVSRVYVMAGEIRALSYHS